MIKIYLNNEPLSVAPGGTIEALLRQLSMDQSERLAIAVNDRVVRRSDWPSHELNDEDQVLMIAPIQGG